MNMHEYNNLQELSVTTDPNSSTHHQQPIDRHPNSHPSHQVDGQVVHPHFDIDSDFDATAQKEAIEMSNVKDRHLVLNKENEFGAQDDFGG